MSAHRPRESLVCVVFWNRLFLLSGTAGLECGMAQSGLFVGGRLEPQIFAQRSSNPLEGWD